MNATTTEVTLIVVALAAALAVLLVLLTRTAGKVDALQGQLAEHHAQLLTFVGHVAGLSVRHRRGRKPGTKNPPKGEGPQERAPAAKPMAPLLAEITQIRHREEQRRMANDKPADPPDDQQANRQ